MKVKLFRKETIEDFKDDHANGKKHFEKLIELLEYADWEEPKDISSSIKGNLLGNGSDRVVFDLGGNGNNAFRIICKYRFRPYKKKVYLYVVWVGTHEEYNALTKDDKLTVWDY